MLRFLHSSDLHIGKRFGNLPEDLRGRLREARHSVIERLAEAARKNGCSIILLAGDTFDTETPTPASLRQSLTAMAADPALQWIILPGNHDSLAADELWVLAERHRPPNVTLALRPAPISLGEALVVLPAPCTTRRPGRDLTDWMQDAQSREGAIRIGLAHGAVQSFAEEGGITEVISPDRARSAGLDYLALGDWHGLTGINDRTWYSGSPEPDRFKHNLPGQALVVAIDAAGAKPSVSPVSTGLMRWTTAPLALLSGEDPVGALNRLLPPPIERRQTLLRVEASGQMRLPAVAAFKAAVEAHAPDFAELQLDDTQLHLLGEAGDLDMIDRMGALRQAAETLLARSRNEALALDERDIAAEALSRLFSYSLADAS